MPVTQRAFLFINRNYFLNQIITPDLSSYLSVRLRKWQ